MARVHIPALLRGATGGAEWVTAEGATVREVVAALEAKYPELQGRLLKGTAVAIDGEISAMGLSERVEPESEVHFVAAIAGGVLPERMRNMPAANKTSPAAMIRMKRPNVGQS
jgi:molybdopterin converting factor small subunit